MEKGLSFEQAAGNLPWSDMGKIMLIEVELFIKRSGGRELLTSSIMSENLDYFSIEEVLETDYELQKKGLDKISLKPKSRYNFRYSQYTPAQDAFILENFKSESKKYLEQSLGRTYKGIRYRYYELKKVNKSIAA